MIGAVLMIIIHIRDNKYFVMPKSFQHDEEDKSTQSSELYCGISALEKSLNLIRLALKIEQN
jgi:hypothetical protein